MATPLDHMRATVRFEIDGLALLCFNQSDQFNKFWEAAFLRDGHHRLRILIVKKSRLGTVKDVRVLERTTMISVPRIIVTTTNPVTPPTPFWQDDRANLDRQQTVNHPEDFRWVPNLTDLSGNVTPRLGHPITLATIPNAIFYSISRSPKMLQKSELPSLPPANPPTTPPISLATFGFTNEAIGADIECRVGGNVNISISALSINVNLPQLADFYHVVTLTNLDTVAAPHSQHNDLFSGDLDKYYNILNVPGGRKGYALWGLERASTIVAGRTDCHAAFVSSIGTFT